MSSFRCTAHSDSGTEPALVAIDFDTMTGEVLPGSNITRHADRRHGDVRHRLG